MSGPARAGTPRYGRRPDRPPPGEAPTVRLPGGTAGARRRAAPPPPRRGRATAPRVGAGGWLRRALIGGLLISAIVVGGTAFRVWQVARVDDRRPVDVVVVLGAAQYDGEPSSIFASRLRHAQELWEQGLAPRILTTGGSRAGDAFTEAEAGRRYLIGRGVPADAVEAIGEGADTLASLRAAAAAGEAEGWSTAIVVSDPWHSLRARTMARDAGLEAWTSPTRSGPVVQTRETQARYIVRETGALLFYRLIHASAETQHTGLG
jgi:uncharacterized SAM-binding protein YcdF (DUF218 family)